MKTYLLDVSENPSKYLSLRCTNFSTINQIIMQINFCHPETLILEMTLKNLTVFLIISC